MGKIQSDALKKCFVFCKLFGQLSKYAAELEFIKFWLSWCDSGLSELKSDRIVESLRQFNLS